MTKRMTPFIQTPLGLADEVSRLNHEKRILIKALEGCLTCLTMDSDSEEDYAQEIKHARAALALAKAGVA